MDWRNHPQRHGNGLLTLVCIVNILIFISKTVTLHRFSGNRGQISQFGVTGRRKCSLNFFPLFTKIFGVVLLLILIVPVLFFSCPSEN